MQEPFRNKKSRGYRLRPATGRDRLDSRVRRLCSRLGILAVVVAAAIVIRSLYNIQIIHGAEYRQYAAQQQLLDTTIKATRGEIYDASGITLASTSVVWTIWADPSYSSILYTSKTNDDDTVTKTLDPAMCAEVSRELTLRLLSGDGESMDSVDTSSAEYQQQYQTVYDALSRLDSSYVTLATKVNNAVKLSIEKYVASFNKAHKKATDTSRKGRISVSSEKSFQRNYPYGAFAAAVLGFTDADGVGTYGLEKSYQSTLAGVDGRTITQRNAVGNAIADANATTFAAKDGSNLVLSLDVNVQEIAERYLNEAIAANTVENRGCAIVMNVKTGAILAMASKPDFDPNDPLNYTANEAYLNELVHAEPELYGVYKKDADGNYITDEQGNKILDEEADYSGYYRDILWKNKAITELYYPGSVFKVITSAMGIDSGVATMNTTFTCSGAYGVAKETYHCAGRKTHGLLNMAEALRKSCNIYYIQLGQRVGSQQFYNYFDAFGFTARTGVDLPSETNFMQYYRADQLGEVQLASSSFGQAMAITPLQMCTAIAATVNGGYLVTPHVVDKITDANGNVIQEIGANVRRQVISQSASEVIREMMEYEVGNGTGGGKNAYVSGYRIGGKSGTSEQLNMHRRADGDYKKVASFVAVLPANDPEILVYVMLDDPNNARTDYSSILAAPVAGNIISEVAPYLGIATDGEDRSGTIVTVPNLVGTEWSNAQVSLNIQGLKHQLQESQSSQSAAPVTYQYPHAGAKVPYGTTIYLYTDTYEGSRTEVPDVTGKSPDFARQMLSAAGLNCVVEGSGTVQAQSAEPGSSVQRGTIITLTCG
ncbi:peptidoglycan D,D-transpeptidase FtsI family protein [Faecalibacterium sp. I4-1-79]|uniref:peptidoglycan D,D-transpeptidase FtsI family protein n=1 Tax=Faecalibacterium sp. I4-1-79 TaxID=2929494 RepID=UPI002014CE3F|nr:penicillin-binding protein 2 [Faecalibacterium sp. I4-1-79]UQK40690.1 PASTA domain-containing protein [Faecalibacterium sp. I4-1-79]